LRSQSFAIVIPLAKNPDCIFAPVKHTFELVLQLNNDKVEGVLLLINPWNEKLTIQNDDCQTLASISLKETNNSGILFSRIKSVTVI
jgi:hypothetical protein